jgi:hypothetical protein
MRDHGGLLKLRPISFKRLRSSRFSAQEQAAYIATARVAAPAGIPITDARSLTHDICRIPPCGIVAMLQRSIYRERIAAGRRYGVRWRFGPAPCWLNGVCGPYITKLGPYALFSLMLCVYGET